MKKNLRRSLMLPSLMRPKPVFWGFSDVFFQFIMQSLKDFTRFFGRLAQDYLVNAKPSKAAFDWQTFLKSEIRGSEKKGYVLPDRISEMFGLKAGEPVSEKVLKRLSFWNPQSTLHDMLRGVPDRRVS